jgi:hypothetical protein
MTLKNTGPCSKPYVTSNETHQEGLEAINGMTDNKMAKKKKKYNKKYKTLHVVNLKTEHHELHLKQMLDSGALGVYKPFPFH